MALDARFLAGLKAATERRWAERDPDPALLGFQFVRGTRWRPGLSDADLARLEAAHGVRLPDDMRLFLKAMNGTEPETLNLYAGKAPPRRAAGVFSFPRDEAAVSERLAWFEELARDIEESLAEQGVTLPRGARLWPILAHRAVVCGPDPAQSPVLSVHPGDTVVYGRDLRAYLEREFLA